VDHVTVEKFDSHNREELARLKAELRAGTYRPQSVRRKWIDKPSSPDKRPLGIPNVRDRVVLTAVRNVLEPIFDITFSEHSYGFRPGRGCHHALERVQKWVAENDLSLHPTKTRVVAVREDHFDFLGYRFKQDVR
jgi:RNA-directed DNA polymerase